MADGEAQRQEVVLVVGGEGDARRVAFERHIRETRAETPVFAEIAAQAQIEFVGLLFVAVELVGSIPSEDFKPIRQMVSGKPGIVEDCREVPGPAEPG